MSQTTHVLLVGETWTVLKLHIKGFDLFPLGGFENFGVWFMEAMGKFNDIQARYGRNVRIKTFHEEEWTVIESRSADVKIADVLEQFELKTHREHIQAAEVVQNTRRRQMS